MSDDLFDAPIRDAGHELCRRGYQAVSAYGVEHIERPGDRVWLRREQWVDEVKRLDAQQQEKATVPKEHATTTETPVPATPTGGSGTAPPKRRRTSISEVDDAYDTCLRCLASLDDGDRRLVLRLIASRFGTQSPCHAPPLSPTDNLMETP